MSCECRKEEEIKRLRLALRQCLENDATHYGEGQPRHRDGKAPGYKARWETPASIAWRALNFNPGGPSET